MSVPKIKSETFKLLDHDLKELVEKALILDGASYLKIFVMAAISQDLRELRRTLLDLNPGH